MTQNEQVILRNTSGAYTITIPVADRLEIQSAIFHLEFSSSISLLDERSQLVVILNGQAIAQIPCATPSRTARSISGCPTRC